MLEIIRRTNRKSKRTGSAIEEGFKIIIWRPAAIEQIPGKYRGSLSEVERVVWVLNGEMKRRGIQEVLQLKHEDHFRDNYLTPALEAGLVEMTIPGKPKSSRQRYRLTAKGQALQQQLKKNQLNP